MEVARDRVPAKVLEALLRQIDESLAEEPKYKLARLAELTTGKAVRRPHRNKCRSRKRGRALTKILRQMKDLRGQQQMIHSKIEHLWMQMRATCECAEEDYEFTESTPDDTLGCRGHWTIYIGSRVGFAAANSPSSTSKFEAFYWWDSSIFE